MPWSGQHLSNPILNWVPIVLWVSQDIPFRLLLHSCNHIAIQRPFFTMVVAQKWTGTNADRHDMQNLKLDQVVRVSPLKMSTSEFINQSPSSSATLAGLPYSVSPRRWSALGKLFLCMLWPNLNLPVAKSLTTNEFCSSLSLSLGNGGTAGLFWTYIITFIGLSLVYLSIAELGSMCASFTYPTSHPSHGTYNI
jgi:hypothetical protein